MNEFDAYMWLALCIFIFVTELYFPYRITLFGSFFASSGISMLVSLISESVPLQSALFIILSFLVHTTIKLYNRYRIKGKGSSSAKAIALCDIKSKEKGLVFMHGKSIEIYNSSDDAIGCGEVVTIFKD